MLESLLENPALAITIAVLALLNYLVWTVAVKARARQVYVDSRTSAMVPGSKSATVVHHFGLPIGMALLASASHGPLVNVFGGYLILQLATLLLNIDAWLHWRILSISGIVEGRLQPSPQYEYRTASSRILLLALFTGVVALLFENLTFAIGSILLFATAAGWFRRGKQRAPAA